MEQPTPHPPDRNAFRLKATYSEYGSFESVKRRYEAHLEHYEEPCRHWEAHVVQLQRRETALIEKRLVAMPAKLHDALVAYEVHAYEGLIDQARSEMRWARRGLALVASLEQAAPAPPCPSPSAGVGDPG